MLCGLRGQSVLFCLPPGTKEFVFPWEGNIFLNISKGPNIFTQGRGMFAAGGGGGGDDNLDGEGWEVVS